MDKSFTSENNMKKIIKNKDTDALVSQLSAEDKQLLETLLRDEDKRREFLSSKKAQSIISSLFKGR